jgi:hypothetical protein
MSSVEDSLCRLQDSLSSFVVPSAVLRNIGALRAQIELRRRALRDIELICSRLRPFARDEKKLFHRRLRGRDRSRLVDSSRRGRPRL